MSDKFVLDAESRDIVGKKVKQLRRNGVTPAVIYGLGEPENVQLDSLKASLALRDASSTEVLTLNLNGKARKVIARDVQRHVVRRDLIHVDFQEVDADSTIRAFVPLRSIGRSVPEAGGLGSTLMTLRSVEIEAGLDSLIGEIVVDLGRIDKPSTVLRVRDLETPEGVSVLTHGDVTVAKFAAKRGGAAATEE